MTVFLTFNHLVNWVNDHLITCPFKYHFGLDCPGCGLQRSMVALAQGDIPQSFSLYPACIPIIALVLFVPLHLKFDFKKGASVVKILYVVIAIVIVLNYIYKIVNHKLH